MRCHALLRCQNSKSRRHLYAHFRSWQGHLLSPRCMYNFMYMYMHMFVMGNITGNIFGNAEYFLGYVGSAQVKSLEY